MVYILTDYSLFFFVVRGLFDGTSFMLFDRIENILNTYQTKTISFNEHIHTHRLVRNVQAKCENTKFRKCHTKNESLHVL